LNSKLKEILEIKVSVSLSLNLMLVLELIVSDKLFMTEFYGIWMKIRIDYFWYFCHGFGCLTWN